MYFDFHNKILGMHPEVCQAMAVDHQTLIDTARRGEAVPLYTFTGSRLFLLIEQCFNSLFPFYATHFLGGFIGQVGFAIIPLAFFYYFGIILLLGAQVNAFISEHVRSKTDDLVEPVYTDANKAGDDQSTTASSTDAQRTGEMKKA